MEKKIDFKNNAPIAKEKNNYDDFVDFAEIFIEEVEVLIDSYNLTLKQALNKKDVDTNRIATTINLFEDILKVKIKEIKSKRKGL